MTTPVISGSTRPRQARSDSPLGVAVIGCGYWGVNYLRVLSELVEWRLAAICEPRRARLDELAASFPEAAPVDELENLLERDDVEAVVVATGAASHFEVTKRCLLAGKHVLVEKPLATNSHQAQELVDLASRHGCILMVGHTFLFNPSVQKIRGYLDDRHLGSIYYLYSRRTNLGPVRQDVNALWDLAPHDISIFNHLLREQPDWVSATGARLLRNGREDVGFITLGYPGGVIGNIHVSWADPNKVRELVVVGSERRVAFDDVSINERLRVFEKSVTPVKQEATQLGEFQLEFRDGDIISPYVEASEPLKNQCRHFAECLRQGMDPLTPGRDGVVVVRVMEAISESVELNGQPVAIAAPTANLPENGAVRSSHARGADASSGWQKEAVHGD